MNFRKSTVEKSDQLQERLRRRELEKAERKAKKVDKEKVVKKVDKKQASKEEEALELSEFRSPQKEVHETAATTDNLRVSTLVESAGSEEEEYWYDSSGDHLEEERSFAHSPPTPLSASGLNPDKWSTVNKFFPEGSEPSPPPCKAEFEFVQSTLQSIIEEESFSSSTEEEQSADRELVEETENAVEEMDSIAIESKLKVLKQLARTIDIYLKRDNEKSVTDHNICNFEGRLKCIFEKLLEMDVAVQDFINQLDSERNKETIAAAQKLYDETETKVLKNESNVQKAIADLRKGSDDEKSKQQVEKVTLRMKNALSNFTSLNNEITKIPKIEELSETQITDYIHASKDWKKRLEKFQSTKEAIDLEVISTDIDDEDLCTRFKTTFETMSTSVTEKMEQLAKADKILGLYSLNDGKSKKTVEYPKKFHGNKGDDVFKFIKEFEDALSADVVRKSDEIKVLLKYLDGKAKSCVGDHHKDVTAALKQLKETFGVPKIIVAEYFKNYEEKYGKAGKWGKHGSQQRLDAIDGSLDFIRHLKSLAEDHESLKGVIYSDKTLETLAKGMPFKYQEKVNEICTHEDSYETWITNIFSVLEDSRKVNVSALTSGFGAAKATSEEKEKQSPQKFSAHSANIDGHNCKKNANCKENWDFLGCVNLYKLSKVDERIEFLKKRRSCFLCGLAPYYSKKNKHVCSWKNGKLNARCTNVDAQGERCNRAAALCNKHKDNATDTLKDWLLSLNIKFTANMIVTSFEILSSNDSYYEEKKEKLAMPISNVTKSKPQIVNREALQSGDNFLSMNDEELHEFFSADMKKINPSATVEKIPEGEPVFIFCVVQGLKNTVMTFIDSGANCWLARDGIPQNEFVSAKLADGPIPLYVASGITTYASAEYGSLIPLADGNFQAVRGLTLSKVTADMPQLSLTSAFEHIKSQCSENKNVTNLKIPNVVGGCVDMILGIKYQSIYPIPVHTFPSGLTVFQSKLKPDATGALACIGGPISTLERLCGTAGTSSTMMYMVNLIRYTDRYTNIDLFPSNSMDQIKNTAFEPGLHSSCVCCGAVHAQSELEKFMRMQDSGLDTSYKCPKCRGCKSCLQGAGQELLNMKEEYQQQIIEDSVRIDDELGRAVARLAFTSDPSENITDNEYIAVKRLKNVCTKYANNSKVREMISKGFQKLVDRKHILLYEDLSAGDQDMLNEEPSYHIPWDIAFKEDSFSTPARPVFDASSKTSGGGSLNDNLAKGKTCLVNLFGMVMGWRIGKIAIHGDISQFYNCVLLDKRDWKFQKVVWYEDLNMENEMKKGVVGTLIYGVTCVSNQTEHTKRLLGDRVRESAETKIEEKVADFIADGFYVDDGGTSVPDEEEADALIEKTDEALGTIQMKVKGWSVSYRSPSSNVTDDATVGFAGMSWIPAIDSYSIKIQPLHFGKKKRGRFPDNLEVYSGGSIADFVPKILTRWMCTSVTARIYDIPGLVAPLALKLKFDLRKLIKAEPEWHKPVGEGLRQVWIENFQFIEEMRDIMYVRCQIPVDAKRCTALLWFLCDASPDGGIIIVAYACYERKDGSWSCQFLCSKSLLTPEGWTTPQAELHGLSSLATLAFILSSVLSTWIEMSRYGCDSSIAISWTVYEKVRLHVFHRLRVSNIRAKIDLEELYHVVGKENIADTGTRPELLKPEHLQPGSDWLCGRDWMKMPVDDAMKSGAIKSVKEIKLDNEAKKIFKEGVMLDSSLNSVSSQDIHSTNVVTKQEKLLMSKNVVLRLEFSQYIISPLKWSYPKFVRIIGYVKLAIRNWKYKLAVKKQSQGLSLSDGSTPESIRSSPPTKFSVFSVFENKTGHKDDSEKLTDLFSVNGVKIIFETKTIFIRLTDNILSSSLEYIYRKTSAELIHFNDKKLVQKVGAISDGIVYCKSRIEESQTLRAVGGLENIVDLKSFTGVNFHVPVIDKNSPVALSIASHLHYNVVKHRGAETVFRISLQYVHILGGRPLMKLIRDECIFCQKLLLKYTQQLMGPLADQQLSISPIFYYTFADAWGPLKAFCPGYSKATRAGNKTYDVYMIVFGCASTGMVNCQIMEAGKNTSNALEAFNRFFDETCVPKIFFIDKDGAMMKCLSEGSVDLLSIDGSLAKGRGIVFETCSAQGHNAHGRIERKIKMVQEVFERSEFKRFKLHGLGWQTVAKNVEHQVNSIPLGYLTHKEDNASLLRVLTPNFLKLNAGANRSPDSLFTLPRTGKDLFSRVEDAYKVFYKVFNEDYVPLIAKRHQWHEEHENLVEGDIIYFKLTDSVLGSKWLVGKVEDVKLSKDGKVRRIIVGYKYSSEEGEKTFRVVERPVRECVKLLNIDDTTIFEDIERVREECKRILGEEELSVTSAVSSSARAATTSDKNCDLNAFYFGAYFETPDEEIYDQSCYNCDIGRSERELGLSSEDAENFFEIDYDLKPYDNVILC